MTGSRAPEVVLVDGYAGPGKYEDGSPGSPLLLVETARKSNAWKTNVRCVFCERDMDTAHHLRQVLGAEAGDDLRHEVFDGPIEQWVAAIVREAESSPMLAFLDPFGVGMPYEALTKQLLARPRHVPTEVLININVEAVWRIGGLLKKGVLERGTEQTLARMDQSLGGGWWREEFAAALGTMGAAAKAADHVVAEFCRRVQRDTGFAYFPVLVRRRPGNVPLFILTLFYRHEVAPWKFNAAVSMANKEWREACMSEDLDKALGRIAVTGSLFSDEEETAELLRKNQFIAWLEQEKRLEAGWVDTIAGNIRGLIAQRPAVKLTTAVREVYGSTLGLARDTHVRKAWDILADEDVVQPRPKNVKYEKALIMRA